MALQSACVGSFGSVLQEVEVRSDPPGATVTLEPDGSRVTTPGRVLLRRGTAYRARFELEGHRPVVVSVTPAPRSPLLRSLVGPAEFRPVVSAELFAARLARRLPLLGETGGTNVVLALDSPVPGVPVGGLEGGLGFVWGRAFEAAQDGYQTVDVVLVIDNSAATATPAGMDIDGDGQAGGGWLPLLGGADRSAPDPDDSLLAAQVSGMQQLLEHLDPVQTRIGVVLSAGGPDVPARTVAPLTSDHAKVRRTLAALLAERPAGESDPAAALELATAELLGLEDGISEFREGAQPAIVLLSHRARLQPGDPGWDAERERARQAAQQAADLGIRIEVLGLGEPGRAAGELFGEIATQSGGRFTAVADLRNLSAVCDGLSLADIDSLGVYNLTLKQPAAYLVQGADGTFGALVPFQAGANQIQTYVRSREGLERQLIRKIQFDPAASVQALSAGQQRVRDELLALRERDREPQTPVGSPLPMSDGTAP